MPVHVILSWVAVGITMLLEMGVVSAATKFGDNIKKNSPYDAAKCAALFGNKKQHHKNRKRRKSLLYWVDDRDPTVIVAHSSDRWKKPREILFVGIELIDIEKENEAQVRLKPRLAAKFGCRPGMYQVEMDDSIGQSRVLDIMANGLLLERNGQLRYLAADRFEVPQWLMAWGSKYRVIVKKKRRHRRPRRPRRRPRKRRRR